jgi:prephenate dehydrogenase
MSFAPPARIAVIGPGLLGGSLLLMLRDRHPNADLRAWARRKEAVEQILRDKLASTATIDLATAVADADLVILCTPVETMPAMAKQIAQSRLANGCVVTDVGSVKAPVVSALEAAFTHSKADFVGSHPMAGSEKSGIEAARADLFDEAAVILTPTIFSSDHALEVVRWLWRLAGCRIIEMSPEEHDRKVARISHLPHLAAWAVTLAALGDDASAAACSGGSFRDVTRIAASDPALWSGILSQNKTEVAAALRDARGVMDGFLSVIESGDEKALRRMIEEARNLRQRALGG